MPLLRTKLTPTGQMRVSHVALGVGALVVLVGLGLLALAHRALPSVGTLFAQGESEPTRKMEMPDVLKPSAHPYAELQKKPEPPVAQPVARQMPPVATQSGAGLTQSQGEEIIKLLRQSAAKEATPPPPDFGELWKQQQDAVRQAAQQQGQPPPQTPTTPKDKPLPSHKTKWKYLAEGETAKEGDKAPGAEEQKKRLAAQGERQDLIKPANWAIPSRPLKTIYRSQTLTGKLLQSMSSDLPGQVKIDITSAVLDKFGYNTIIIPKDTIVIASQEGKVTYGMSRISIRLEQLEFPTGEVVNLKATVGDNDGSNGLAGKTNSHYGKLILATGLSAILNIGVRAAAGTPGQGSYFENPVQSASRDIGQSVQRDAQGIVDRELRLPPTITIKSGTVCTINLQENVQFHRDPIIAK